MLRPLHDDVARRGIEGRDAQERFFGTKPAVIRQKREGKPPGRSPGPGLGRRPDPSPAESPAPDEPIGHGRCRQDLPAQPARQRAEQPDEATEAPGRVEHVGHDPIGR